MSTNTRRNQSTLARDYVTHGEFSQFTQQTDRRMTEILGAVNELRSIATRPANYGLLIAAVTALGSFILLYTNPISQRADRNSIKYDQMQNQYNTELTMRAKWMGGIDRDVYENSHELDLLWNWRHDKVDSSIDRYDERMIRLEERIERIESEQDKRTDRVYGAQP